MLLYFILLFGIINFKVINGWSNFPSKDFSNIPFPIELEKSLNRTQRLNKVKHQAVCGELDKTEDTYFVAVIITKHRGRLLCMGSIIDEYHVLTAKNCLDKTDAATLMVIGGYQSPYYGRNSQVKFAEKIIKHEFDLAIIRLQTAFHFTLTVKAIRVIGPEKLKKPLKDAYKDLYAIVGFNVPKHLERTDYLPKPSAYRITEEKLSDDSKCDPCHKTREKKFTFCTDGKSLFGWTGVGSPTIIAIEKEYVQIGVLVKGTCEPDATINEKEGPHNLHIRIDKFYKWIKANSYIGR